MSTPFPLFCVPHVVFRDFLKSMDFVEIINLSRCSQKSKRIVRNNLFRLKDVKIRVVSNEGIFVSKENQDELCIYDVSKLNSKIIPFIDGWCRPKTLSDRQLKFATEHFTFIFKLDIHTIQFGYGSSWLLDLVNEQRTKVQKIVLDHSKWIDQSELGYILEDSHAEELVVLGSPVLSGEYDGKFGNFDTFYQIAPGWLTIEHLISMYSSKMFMAHTKLKNEHLNRFLKHWVNGGSPQLEFLNIGIQDIDEEEILFGLEEYVTRTDNRREYKWEGERHRLIDETYTFDGLEIVSKDGARASLKIQNWDRLAMRTEFRMTVWPRS